MMDVRKIWEGWRNLALPPSDLKEKINQVATHRRSICDECEYNSKNIPDSGKFMDTCTLCNCPLSAKTRCLSCNCGIEQWNKKHPYQEQPLKWEAVVDPEERAEIELRIKEDKDAE